MSALISEAVIISMVDKRFTVVEENNEVKVLLILSMTTIDTFNSIFLHILGPYITNNLKIIISAVANLFKLHSFLRI